MTDTTQDCLARLLIVDDEPAIRTTLSFVLAEIGYQVRSAEDGFSAMLEIRKEVPDILLSDLNMPGMSGFDLLSMVRRWFPTIQTIAMSGAFAGDEVPSGVAADGFYQKGSSMRTLLRVMKSLPQPDRMPSRHPLALTPVLAPVWIQRSEHGTGGDASVRIACPERPRTFSEVPGDTTGPIGELGCG
jgi:CheY-like chemotaxis protein